MTASAVIPGHRPARSIVFDRPGREGRSNRCHARQYTHASATLELTFRPGVLHECGTGAAETIVATHNVCHHVLAGREDTALLRSNRSARPGPRFEGRTIHVVRRFSSCFDVCLLLFEFRPPAINRGGLGAEPPRNCSSALPLRARSPFQGSGLFFVSCARVVSPRLRQTADTAAAS